MSDIDTYILVLDDTRSLEEVMALTPVVGQLGLPLVLCKDYKQAQKQIVDDPRLVAHLALDWNLYGSPNHMNLTGLDFAQWVAHADGSRRHGQLLTVDFTFSVHSSDAARAKEIEYVLSEHQLDLLHQ